MSSRASAKYEQYDNPILDSHVQYMDGTLTYICRELSQSLSQYEVVRLKCTLNSREVNFGCGTVTKWNNFFYFSITEDPKYSI